MHRATLFLPLLSLALLVGCGSSNKSSLPSREADGAVGVRVIQPRDRIDGGLTRVTGKLVPRNEALITAKATGPISAMMVDVGDRVKKGDVLARIDPSNAAIGLEQAKAAEQVAKAAADNARQEWERAKKLRASGGIAQAGLDRAEAGHAQAQAGYAQATAARKAAQQFLSDHTIRAPFDGIVTERMQNLGEFVAMAPVFSLVDVDNLEVVLPIPESVIGAVRPDATVKGIISPSGQPFSAKVRVIGQVVSPEGRTVEVRGDLVGERTTEMRPHAIVEVEFTEGETGDGLFLPRQAVRGGGEGGTYVWLVEDGLLVRRDVQTQQLAPGTVRVTSGLQGDERIVSDAGGSFQEGMKVRPLP